MLAYSLINRNTVIKSNPMFLHTQAVLLCASKTSETNQPPLGFITCCIPIGVLCGKLSLIVYLKTVLC